MGAFNSWKARVLIYEELTMSNCARGTTAVRAPASLFLPFLHDDDPLLIEISVRTRRRIVCLTAVHCTVHVDLTLSVTISETSF